MKLIFRGTVQGVGFRPTIFRIAKDMGLKGYVLNKGSEVEIVIDKKINEFIKKVKRNLPEIAEITEIIKKPDDRSFDDFKILYSKKGKHQSLIPVDIGICDGCLEELFDKKNRRYHYPFTNCTICGARFSLIKDVPYDRERTSMKAFDLCENCKKEYTSPRDRRYHAQTISCPNCGPVYHLYDNDRKNLGSKDAVSFFAKKIDAGHIGVIKSWGGMHLCCKISEVEKFRRWYQRSQKPFAIMVRDIKAAAKYTAFSKYEKKMLLSNGRPIVLLEKKKAENISPGLNTIGVFLPYTGIQHILFSYLKSDALIMTSANIPGEPMLTSNKDAFSLDADFYLLHNRDIPNRVDDTVMRVWKDNRFFIRKSRGFVPDPISVSYNHQIISVGAGQNIVGAVSADKKIFPTQYIGDSDYYKSLEFLDESIRHMMKLSMDKKRIDAVVQDLHPGYDTRKVAKRFSEDFDAPLFDVQHHYAHAAALMLEKNVDESVVLALDGLGYGDDDTFWGGEVLVSDFNGYKRVGHLEYIKLIGGDKATFDPRRLVFAIFKNYGKVKFFSDNKAEVLSKLMKKSPVSSSFGRVLDALSCYLDVCCKRTYDGEPAMKLERYLSLGKPRYSFDLDIKNGAVQTKSLFKQLDEKIKKPLDEKQKANYAHSFVKAVVDGLVDIAVDNANKKGIKNIGLSGGVTYDVPIVEMVDKRLKKTDIDLLVHDRLPNGDGCIAIGQNVIVGNKL